MGIEKDQLTGFWTEKALKEYMENEILRAERYKRELSFILFHFSIPQKFQLDMMFPVLRRIASEILDHTRRLDLKIRMGNRLLIVVPETSLEGAKMVGSKITESLQGVEFFYAPGEEYFHLTIKHVVGSFPQIGTNRKEIVKNLTDLLEKEMETQATQENKREEKETDKEKSPEVEQLAQNQELLVKEIDSRKEIINKINSEIAQILKSVEELNTRFQSAEAELSHATAEREKARESLTEIRATVHRLLEEKEQGEKDKSDAQDEIIKAEQMMITAQKKLRKAQKQVDDAGQKLYNAREEQKRLEENLQKTADTEAERKENKEKLEKELNQLKASLDKLRQLKSNSEEEKNRMEENLNPSPEETGV